MADLWAFPYGCTTIRPSCCCRMETLCRIPELVQAHLNIGNILICFTSVHTPVTFWAWPRFQSVKPPAPTINVLVYYGWKGYPCRDGKFWTISRCLDDFRQPFHLWGKPPNVWNNPGRQCLRPFPDLSLVFALLGTGPNCAFSQIIPKTYWNTFLMCGHGRNLKSINPS